MSETSLSILMIHYLIWFTGRLTVQNSIMDGGEQTGFCDFFIKETSGLQVFHHDSCEDRHTVAKLVIQQV